MNLKCSRATSSVAAQSLLRGIVAAILLSSSAFAQVAPLEVLGPGAKLIVPSGHAIPSSDAFMTWTGSVTSQGDGVMSAPLARSTYNVNGDGIKVGIISDSFNLLGGMAAGIASGNLPGPGNPNSFVTPVNIVESTGGGIDEGRAMAELIHDVAPGAELMFHSAFNGVPASPGSQIAAAINNLASAGADIIVDDISFLFSPTYQDGVAAQAAKAAYNAGIPYFSSAGNNSNNAYEGTYSPIFGTNHNFDANANEGGDNILNIGAIPNNGQVRATLWWDDPYPSSGGGTPTTNFQLGLYDFDLAAVVDGSSQNQLTGADAFEFINFTNTTGATHSYGLFVEHSGGVANKLLKIQIVGQQIADDDDTNSPTVFGHAAAEGAVAVAASSVFSPNTPEAFTGLGPTTILYDTAGNKLANAVIRDTPLITGPDGGNTSFFGIDSALDGDTDPNFFGTSAAAPHVAAVAALLMERAADLGFALTPTQIYNILFNSTVDIHTPGFDNLTGWGRLDALAALAKVPEPGTLLMSVMALGLWIGATSRRRQVAA